MATAINPEAIPGADLDPDTIEAQAGVVTSVASRVRENGSDVHLKWQGMAGVYSAPESGRLLGLMQPVSSQATAVGDNLDVVAGALKRFAADIRPIKAELDSLRAQAVAFNAEIAGGVSVREVNPAWINSQSSYGGAASYSYSSSSLGGGSTSTADIPQYRTVSKEWHEVQSYVDRNNDLIGQVNAQQTALWEAERACANTIRALYGAAGLRAYQSEDDALGYGLSEIPEGTEMPWGAEVERTEGCGEATAKFVFKDFLWEGIAVGGVWGTIEGLGTLVLGYNPETGDWFSGDAYGAAWGNLGMLGAAGLMNSGLLAPIFQADSLAQSMGGDGFLPQEVRDFKADADEVAVNTGKALIAWDKWADDPGTALGESVFNVGTILIPGGAAVAGVKTAGTAASVLSKMSRAVDVIDPGAWAVNGATRLGSLGLGSLDNLIGKVDGFESPNIEVYTATDAASGMQLLDDFGVDPNTVTARVDGAGNNVLEFPGGKIEMPAGTFDNAAGGAVRAGDGGAETSVAAPVREPELVTSGGVRGETTPGAMNSIVDDAPVRTETGGTGGESTVVREPDTATGGDASGGEGPGGSGGSGVEGSDLSSGGPDDVPPPGGNGGDPAPAAAGDEGGWRSSEGADLSLDPAQRAAVDEYLAGSRAAEPRITADMQAVQDLHPEARMEGLEYRLKGDESMYRKVATELDQMAPGAPAGPVVGGMKDSIRYTFVVAEESYTAGVNGIIGDLSARGYEPVGALKNTWGSDGYQGINSNWVDPQSGRIIEVQFHTDASLAAKMDAHGLYEQSRLPGVDSETLAQLNAEQADIFGRVDRPDGATDIDWPAPSRGVGIDDHAFFTGALDDQGWSTAEANTIRRTPLSDLTDAQAEGIHQLRESVPPVTPGTPMSKVIPIDDIDKYIGGEYSQLGGFMTRAGDYDGGSRSLAEVVDELRLDYTDSPFTRPDADRFAVIDFEAGAGVSFDVPYGPRLGGDHDWPAPFTGNGFTAAGSDVMVPEFVSSGRFTPPEGAVISVVENGSKTPVAVYTNGEFRRIGGAQ
ncbi:hypothetical protein [Microbacterium aurantiacum]|uniref:WXG100 family type VII secretion target n=1 Tax=Microbacterium aurantiacum TaxID=162393 RepID=A0AAJ2HIQ3_9MICO|nr:hypothetical protein [Microbacterium aurantiacum]MDS0245104.1 hypothetical protein [Microbacterium aurantiacum]